MLFSPLCPQNVKSRVKVPFKMIDRTQKCPFPKSAPCPLSILAKTLVDGGGVASGWW